jgi:HEAT repeat protein
MQRHFRHTILAAVFCTGLLVIGSVVLFHTSAAKSDPIAGLLNLPAPPPPNPAVQQRSRYPYGSNLASFKAGHPPQDDAPIDDLIEYWGQQSNDPRVRRGTPSAKTVERLLNESRERPEIVSKILNILPGDKDTADAVKALYERSLSDETRSLETGSDTEAAPIPAMKQWLKFNSGYFSNELEKVALHVKDTDVHYVTLDDENSVLALTRYDWEHANSRISQMYGDHSQPVTQVLATWALYRHALDTDSSSDVERYRGELMRMVEDRSLPDGVRDKANDALMLEKDFPGREEWTISLFQDETLVNMPQYTMLTTLMTHEPSDKYVPRLIELLDKNSKPVVRTGAVRSLMLAMPRSSDDEQTRQIVKAMLPWLSDESWAAETGRERSQLVQKLAEIDMPEAVPALIKLLDEKHMVDVPDYNGDRAVGTASNTNSAVRAPMIAANAAMAMAANAVRKAGAKDTDEPPTKKVEQFTYRSDAIRALGKQRDLRAVPALRRMINLVEGYERQIVIGAIYNCGGFTLPEQVDAIDLVAHAVMNRQAVTGYGNYAIGANSMSNIFTGAEYAERLARQRMPPSPVEIRTMLGQLLMMDGENISNELARAVVDRIETLDKQEPELALAYRSVLMHWSNAAVNVLFLRDAKRGIATTDMLVRLLATRHELKQKQPADISDLRTGSPSAVGIAACMLEDNSDYETILDSGSVETKTALLACARLIRASLNIQKAAANLGAKEPLLAEAAEQYLISEDSPEARAAVLARHHGEAMILGAQYVFPGSGKSEGVPGFPGISSNWLVVLFYSASDSSAVPYSYEDGPTGVNSDISKVEKSLRDEVKKDDTLLGIYAFDKNYIRIYRDRAMFSWDDDESRYYERPLATEEFEEIKSYIAQKRADELPPFLYCPSAYCPGRELLMLGRNGGRRVFVAADQSGRRHDDIFTGLDKYFAELKRTPASLKYDLSRELPGLEIGFADPDLHAETVWKNGDDLRVAVSSAAVRKQVDAEIAKAGEVPDGENSDQDDETAAAARTAKAEKMAEQRAFEGYSWHRIQNGTDAGISTQPPDVDYIPFRDALSVQPTQAQWKARTSRGEVRGGTDGLFMISHGQAILLQKGDFGSPVVTPNGRWAIALQNAGEDSAAQLLRADLTTRKIFPVASQDYSNYEPLVYIPSINKILVVESREYDDEGERTTPDDTTPTDYTSESMMLLDPDTGVLSKPTGELRPLSQQTFRPLQRTAAGNTFWAAMPDHEKRATAIGTYDAVKFSFHHVMSVPKIVFNSMDMWVDEPGQRIYFVYRGHLLSLPLKTEGSSVTRPSTPSTRH